MAHLWDMLDNARTIELPSAPCAIRMSLSFM